MRLRAVHILLLLAAVAGLTGCRRARVIPEKKMVRIYADMFLADQWVRDHPDAREIADTTLLFDPIFKRYGYDFADYDKSINYYLDHPVEYADIVSKASERLRARSEALQIILDADRKREEELDSYRRLYHPKDFSTDSLRWSGVARLWPPVDTLKAAADSLQDEPAETWPAASEPEGSDTWEEVKPMERQERPKPVRIRVEDMKKEELKKTD